MQPHRRPGGAPPLTSTGPARRSQQPLHQQGFQHRGLQQSQCPSPLVPHPFQGLHYGPHAHGYAPPQPRRGTTALRHMYVAPLVAFTNPGTTLWETLYAHAHQPAFLTCLSTKLLRPPQGQEVILRLVQQTSGLASRRRLRRREHGLPRRLRSDSARQQTSVRGRHSCDRRA